MGDVTTSATIHEFMQAADAEEAREDIGLNKASEDIGLNKASFIVVSDSTVSVSTDIDSPSLITSYESITSVGMTLITANGAIRNDTGRDIAGITGNIAMQIDSTGSTKVLSFWSEFSSDGITFTPIANSLRQREVANSNESFMSTVSFRGSWLDGHYVRFVFHSSGAGLSFESPTVTSNSVDIDGRSIVWEMTEQ